MPDTALPLVPVVSSNIAGVGYDEATQTLDIAFQGRTVTVYRYTGVPADVHTGLMASLSKGEYFERWVKRGGYPFRKLNPDSAASQT